MTANRRMTRADAEAMAAQVEAGLAAGGGSVNAPFAGADVSVQPQADGGFTIQDPSGAVAARMYLTPATMPDDYPPGLPFVPHESVTSMGSNDSSSLIWWAPAAAAALLAQLDRQTLNSGWALTNEARIDTIQAIHRDYAKPGRERILMAMASTVTLIEKRVQSAFPFSGDPDAK